MPQGRPEDYAIEEIMQMIMQQQAGNPRKGNLGGPSNAPEQMRGSGTVRMANPSMGYGFIEPDAGGKDVFLHQSAGPVGFEEGDRYEYDTQMDRRGKGPMAVDPELIGERGMGVSDHPKGRQHDPAEDYVGAVPGGTDPMARELSREVIASGVLEDLPNFGGDSSYIVLQEFMATPEGQTAADLLRKGDTETIKELFNQFTNMQYDMPDLPQ